jgi:membrane-bound serine protease (ClpP class)
MKPMRSVYLRIFLLVVLSVACAQNSVAEIVRVVIKGPIQVVTEEQIGRAIDQAKDENAAAVVIELSTPGGLVDAMRGIVSKIEASPVPVIVYVTPSGSHAASAGFYILESADVAAMAPGTTTGVAHPVILYQTMDPVMKEKVENDLAAFMRSFVTKRGRNADAADSGVRQSKAFTEKEALDLHLIEYVSPSLDDLLKTLDGKTINRFDGSKTTLHLAGQPIRTLELTVRQRVLGVLLDDPELALLMLIIGALLIYAEFNFPGTIAPGAIGAVLVVLALFAMNYLPLNLFGAALLLAAIVLFVLEAKFGAHGALAIAGIVALVFGSLMLIDAPIPEMRVHVSTAIALAIAFGGITTFLTTLAIRARRNKSMTGAGALVGTEGIVRVPLAPRGKVFVNGEIWDAFCSEGAQVGDAVRVIAIKGFLLSVEKISRPAPINPPTHHQA